MDRRALRAARRADASGSGPTLGEREPSRNPGATGAFALFGEVLMTGLLVTIAGLAIVTLPAALAAGIRHMRRYAAAEGSPYALFWQDVRKALPGGLVVGVAGVALTLLLLLDIDLANSGFLPGGAVIGVVGWAGLVAGAVALLTAAAAWSPDTGWRAAFRAVPAAVGADLTGALFLAATAVFVGVVTWMLVPLIIPALGSAVLAAVAIPGRRRRGAH
ncbi:hypothetical protein [Microbacterium sp. SS28]|uniref:hypothetical protein n=1 Tax=Microbacterium sp. SS28 TaxID=2919948 RepID=UPI001FAAA963|nr:hypothetical protein [Microbacterium sp. SS28]